MKSNDIIQLVLRKKIIAIVRGVDPDDCVKTAKALCDGGIRMIEVTFNQKSGSCIKDTTAAIAAVRAELGNKISVGAGTVVTLEQLEKAHEAGAEYAISPDTNVDVIKRTKELGMVSMPGAMTPTEILEAHEAGADFVKIFPAANFGVSYIKAITAPVNHIPLLAVGGINTENITDYLNIGMAGVGVGGNLANKEWIRNGEFHRIEAAAREYVSIVESNKR